MHVIRFLPKQSARIFIDLAHRPLIEPRLVNERFSPSMASGVVSTTFSTSTSTGDPSMATLFIADAPCSEIRLSSCESSESCVVQILPSALCWDNTYSTWTFESALSCIATSTPLTVPVVTYPQNYCPLGMTMAKSAVKSDGGWCCPLGFTWATPSLCQSSLTPGMFPQISDACAQENTFAFTPDTTQLLRRATETAWYSDISSPVPTTSIIGPRAPAESAVTAIFAEAVYLVGQALPSSTLIVPDSFTPVVSPSGSWSDSDEEGPKGLSDLAKVAIGLGSGVVGSFLILLGVFLIRRHRKRRLHEAAKDEMAVTPSPGGHMGVRPEYGEGGNTNRAIFDPTRTRCDLEPVSPTEPVHESNYLLRPELERPKEKVKAREGIRAGERARSEVTSFSGVTFFSMNHFEPFELDAEPPSETEGVKRQNTRASSQVLPWQSGIYDEWILNACAAKNPEQEHELI
ncbi:hypothetical protein F4823DRAFT_586282 [Ustulina deusta]|nr:hypothetical protein F4823DRAFT_586282 [Ustulina deusta]